MISCLCIGYPLGMKQKKHYYHIHAILGAALALFSACVSEPPPAAPPIQVPAPQVITETLMPLTPALLDRLRGSLSFDEFSREISHYPFHLFGRVSLERDHVRQSQSIDGGQVRLVDEYIREIITFHDQTPGLAISLELAFGNTIILSVAFDDNVDSTLRFAAPASEPDAFFQLLYEPDRRINPLSDERGLLYYGGNEYKLRYSGERSPALLVRLSQRDVDLIYTRVAPGRRVN